MKNKLKILILTICLAVLFTVSASALSLGDLDGNGKLTAADARLALRASAKIEKLSEEQFAAADLDGNGKVTSAEARTILRAAAGLANINGDSPAKGLLIEDGVLHIAVSTDNKPFAYTENGELTGFDVDYAKKLAKELSLKAVFHEMPQSDIQQSLDNKVCDIALGMAADKESNPQFSISDTYFNHTLYVISRADVPVNSLRDISGKVGVIENSFAYDYLTEQIAKGVFNADILTFEDCKAAQYAIAHYDICAFVTSDYLAVNSMDEVCMDSPHFEQINRDCAVFASKDNAALTDIINKHIPMINVTSLSNQYIENIKAAYIKTDKSSLTLSKGGVGMIRIEYYSPYVMSNVGIERNLSFAITLAEDEYPNNNTGYLFVYATENSSGTIELKMYGFGVCPKVSIPVYLQQNTNDTYQINNSTVPDFGAFTGTAPYAVNTGSENGYNVFTAVYNVDDLINNGVTNDVLSRYLTAIESKGFEYTDEISVDGLYALEFYKESTDEVGAYMEFDDGEYIYAISIGIEYK